MILSFIYGLIATVSFGVLFQAPKKVLVTAGFIGAVGWVTFSELHKTLGYDTFYASFYATIVISVISEIMARIQKKPAIVFNIPAIIPLVPGLGMYQGMRYIINNDFLAGGRVLLNAALDSGAIAFGIMLVAGIFRAYKIKSSEFYKKEEEETV